MPTFDFGSGSVPAHQHANGGGWVADTATVADTAFVGPNARVYGNAHVYGNALVYDTACVLSTVYGTAEVYGNEAQTRDSKFRGTPAEPETLVKTRFQVIEEM